MLAHVGDAHPHDLLDQVVAGAVVVIDRRGLQFGLLGDVCQSKAGIAFHAQHMRRGIEYPGARLSGLRVADCVGPVRRNRRRSVRRPFRHGVMIVSNSTYSASIGAFFKMNFERGRSHGASRASELLTRVFLGEMAIADAEDTRFICRNGPNRALIISRLMGTLK